jgi:hypothetical protein
MDVHAPHEPVNSWKDFAIHLSIVTVGLFIALMLEAGVEYLHHRHIVAEARENIRRELEHNQQAAAKDIQYIDENVKALRSDVRTIRVLRTHPMKFHGGLENTMSFDTLDDSAWRTARDTGALSYMPYEEVQRYSDAYMLADQVNSHAVKAGEADFQAAAPLEMGDDPTSMPDAEYTRMLEQDADVVVQMNVLEQFLKQYQQLDEKLLHK